MPKIVLEHVTKRYNNFYAVDDLNLVMEDNSFITLLGPSGCGKTTTLRMIAGLETPTSGRITIGDKVVFDSDAGINVPASKRKVGFLFQNYALWPNMTVYQNISFGLKNVKEEMSIIDYKLKNSLKIIEILKKSKDIITILKDTLNKDKKVDYNRALIKIIDTFEVSKFTAKEILNFKLDEAQNLEEEVNKLLKNYEEKVNDIKKHNDDKHIILNDEFEVIKDGLVIKKIRKLDKEEIDLAVRRCARIVKIGEFMDRYPNELSGGQQQRVAIARTLAPQPHVLFMDEPLSNLDAKLRLEMRGELQRLHLDTGSTFVYVTHDQLEAMTLATKICLINNGVLQQYDAPLDVYNKPKNTFVADFVGNPSINFIEGKVKQEKESLKLNIFNSIEVNFVPKTKIDLNKWHKEEKIIEDKDFSSIEEKKSLKGFVEKHNKDVAFKYRVPMVNEPALDEEYVIKDDDIVLAVRPEFLKFSKDGKIKGRVYSSMPSGMETTLRIEVNNYLLTVVIFGGIYYKLDEEVKFDLFGDGILLYDRKSGKLISEGKII